MPCHGDFIENLKLKFSFADPEIALVYPTQGRLRASEGLLRFNVAQVRQSGGDAPFKKYHVEVTLRDAKGEVHSASSEFDGHRAECVFEGLPEGLAYVSARLLKGKKPEPVDLLEQHLEVVGDTVADTPRGACTVDRFGRTLVDGKPFLPIGLYTGSCGDFDLIFNSDFNCIMAYGSYALRLPADKDEGDYLAAAMRALDKLEENGFKLIFSLKDLYDFNPFQDATRAFMKAYGGASPEETAIRIAKIFGRHPALLAWYLNDEIPLANRDGVIKLKSMMNSVDPYHPTWATLCDFAETPLMARGHDIIGVDPYPIMKDKPAEQSRCVDAMDAVERSGQASWVVPQIFNWGLYRARKNPSAYPKYHSPTLDQMRGLTLYKALRGARGFIFYSFYNIFSPSNMKEFKEYGETFEECLGRWEDVKQLATLLKSISPWLLSEKGPEKVELKVEDGRAEAARFLDEKGTPLYLIANVGPDDPMAILTLPEDSPKMRACFGHGEEISPGVWKFSGEDIWGEMLLPE